MPFTASFLIPMLQSGNYCLKWYFDPIDLIGNLLSEIGFFFSLRRRCQKRRCFFSGNNYSVSAWNLNPKRLPVLSDMESSVVWISATVISLIFSYGGVRRSKFRVYKIAEWRIVWMALRSRILPEKLLYSKPISRFPSVKKWFSWLTKIRPMQYPRSFVRLYLKESARKLKMWIIPQ